VIIELALVKTMIAHHCQHKAILGCAPLCRTDLRCIHAAPLTRSESPGADASLLELSRRNPLKFGRDQHRLVERRTRENTQCVGYGRYRRLILNRRSKCIETARLIRDHTDLDLWPLAFPIAADLRSNKLRAKAPMKIELTTRRRNFLLKPRATHRGFKNIPHLDDTFRPEVELRYGAHIRRRIKRSRRAFVMRTGRNLRPKATNVPAMAYLQV
jgi:hypothetical protein